MLTLPGAAACKPPVIIPGARWRSAGVQLNIPVNIPGSFQLGVHVTAILLCSLEMATSGVTFDLVRLFPPTSIPPSFTKWPAPAQRISPTFSLKVSRSREHAVTVPNILKTAKDLKGIPHHRLRPEDKGSTRRQEAPLPLSYVHSHPGSNQFQRRDPSRYLKTWICLNVKQIARPLTVATSSFRPLLICLGVQVDDEPLSLLLNLLSLLFFFNINDQVGRQSSSSFQMETHRLSKRVRNTKSNRKNMTRIYKKSREYRPEVMVADQEMISNVTDAS
ncbi:hypothetical protein B0H12DRAFT_1247268 [Mycena haematopus]|nr:hypothetical protein B0H12DRAFT_1247268 [Mycena haematopus]